MMKTYKLWPFIEEVSEIDSIIDFSKGLQQFKVFLTIVQKGKVSLNEISDDLSIEKDKLYDILYKLKRKGLIASISRSEYCPTTLGLSLYNKLTQLSLGKSHTSDIPLTDIAKDIVLIAGSSFKGRVSYSYLCKYFKTTKNTINYLIKPYLIGSSALFRTQGDYLILTKRGRKVFEELAKEIGLGVIGSKIITKVGASKHPSKAIRNLFKAYTVLTIIILFSIFTPYFVVLASIALFVSLVMGTLVVFEI